MQNQTAYFYPKHTAGIFQAAVFVCGKNGTVSNKFQIVVSCLYLQSAI